MKTIPAALLADYQLGTTTLATCWKITLTSGIVHAFTDCDKDLMVDGILYKASSGFSPSAFQSQTKMAVDNLQIKGVLIDEVIPAADLASGLWDFATVEMFMVNANAIGHGKDILSVGKLGQISIGTNSFESEIRGLANAYSQVVGEIYQPGCRAKLGDARCGVNLAPWTVTGTITAVAADQLTAYDSSRAEADGYFTYGVITMTSGASSGLSMDVKSSSGATIVLQLEFANGIAIGDTYSMVAGCAKRFNDDCVGKFNNAINFRGEPHLPGTDKIYRIGGQ